MRVHRALFARRFFTCVPTVVSPPPPSLSRSSSVHTFKDRYEKGTGRFHPAQDRPTKQTTPVDRYESESSRYTAAFYVLRTRYGRTAKSAALNSRQICRMHNKASDPVETPRVSLFSLLDLSRDLRFVVVSLFLAARFNERTTPSSSSHPLARHRFSRGFTFFRNPATRSSRNITLRESVVVSRARKPSISNVQLETLLIDALFFFFFFSFHSLASTGLSRAKTRRS